MTYRSTEPSKRTGFARFFSRGNAALLEIVGDRIRREGKITFAEFMGLALYHPQLGYYNSSRDRIGKHGDFLTSPETHPLFGALLTRQLEQMWRDLGHPRRFGIVEMGAGPGTLCRDILTYARATYPDFFAALRYKIVESSPSSIFLQKALLRKSGLDLRSLRWYSSLSQLPARGITGCFISNELIDAFPVHRVINEGGTLREVYVGLENGELVDVVNDPSTPAIVDYFNWVGVPLPEGYQGEVNLGAVEWMREVARRLNRGFAITIDYGYPAEQLYSAEHRRGTLLCYYKQTFGEDPYVRVGQQDITSHVDFTALGKEGEAGGLHTMLLATQSDYLISLGLPAFVEALAKRGLGAVEYRANRLAIEELVKPGDLGRLKVLVQSKGIDNRFSHSEPLSLPFAATHLPLLPAKATGDYSLEQFAIPFDTP